MEIKWKKHFNVPEKYAAHIKVLQDNFLKILAQEEESMWCHVKVMQVLLNNLQTQIVQITL